MNIRLRLKPSHALIFSLLLSVTCLYSCGKDADPLVIKVSSTPISGLVPSTQLPVNTGDGGIAVGALNTCIIKVGTSTTTITFAPPTDTLKAGVGNLLVLASVESGSVNAPRYFGLLSGAQQTGLFDITGCSLTLNGEEYLAGTGEGKVKYTKFEASDFVDGSANKVALQGTFDLTATNINTGAKKRIVGSFNMAK